MEEKVEEKASISSWAISCFSDDISNLHLNNFSVSKYYILFDDYKHNHLAHGMVALLKLGSNDTTIKNYMEDHTKICLETIPKYESNNKISLKPSPCKWAELTEYLGDRKNYYGLFAMFENKLSKQHNNNISDFLSAVFPSLSPGVCGGAFHGLIHLGYGASVNNKQIILEGLALLTMQYLEFRYKPSKNLQIQTNDEKSMDENVTLIDVLNVVRKENKLKNIILTYKKNKNLDIKNLSLFGNEIISDYLELIADKIPKSMKEIKEWLLSTVINVYCYVNGLDFNDFFILHGVTSAWSLIQLLPYLETNKLREKAVLEFLHGFIAIYVVQGQHEFIKAKDANYTDKQLQEIKTKTLEIINNDIKPKDNQKTGFKRVHTLKVTQIILECMESNIIDAKCAFDTIELVQKEFHF